MSQDIIIELNFFINSFLIGVVITFVYDWLLILRRCIRHSIAFISLEDVVFWFCCALGVFYMLYRENNGVLRWFAIAGATMGMWVYKKFISSLFVRITSTTILRTVHFFVKPILFIKRKIFLLFKRIVLYFQAKLLLLFKKLKILLKIVKKKLTMQLRVFKIYLCKQRTPARNAGIKQ